MVRERTGRQVWGPWCDHWTARPPMATWYEPDARRLRVSYMVDEGVFWLFSARGSKWVLESPRLLHGRLTPRAARARAYAWLKAEAKRRFPEAPAAVVNPVGHKSDGRLRTVRR